MSSALVTRFAVAVQAAKGTAASTGFHAMRNTQSQVPPEFDYEEAMNEHTGVHQRASSRQSTPDRISYRANPSFQAGLYPNAIGALLVGVGFNGSSVDNTTHKTHTFTKANVDAAKWITVMQALLAGAARFERKIKDVRLTQLEIAATRTNIAISGQGIGLGEGLSAGTETVASDVNERIIPPTGSLTFGSLALGAPQTHTITVTRPVDEEDQKQHSFYRADAPEAGFEINGVMTGLDMSVNSYKKLVYGGVSGTEPSVICVTDSLTWLYNSARLISGAAVPYSLQLALLKAEFRLSPPVAQGNDIVRLDLAYSMIDDSASAPATWTLNNGVASY